MEKIQSLRAEQSRAEQLNCCVRLGNYINGNHSTGYAGNVWDEKGICPTIDTCQGGGRQPHIVEVKELNTVNDLGFIDNGTGKHQSNTVYGEDGLCPNITTVNGGGTQQIKIADVKELNDNNMPKLLGGLGEQGEFGKQYRQGNRVYDADGTAMALTSQPLGNAGGNSCLYCEKQIVAMRGRDKDNPSDRTVGNKNLEQRLEPNSQGICNTLTSVQKDNLVMEKQKIKIRQATKDGFIECELPGVADLNYPSSNTRRGRVIEGGGSKSNTDNGEYP